MWPAVPAYKSKRAEPARFTLNWLSAIGTGILLASLATASTGQHGQEGKILRFVFWHSIVLAAIMGGIVMLQAYVFSRMIP